MVRVVETFLQKYKGKVKVIHNFPLINEDLEDKSLTNNIRGQSGQKMMTRQQQKSRGVDYESWGRL